MPSKSAAQHRLMQAVSHSPAFAKKVGIPQSVGSDFERADKGRKFAKGGETMATKLASLFKGKESYSEELKEGKAIKSGKITPEQYAKGEKMEMMKKPAKKMAKGGFTSAADGVAQKGKTKGMQVKMNRGGKC
jgi:hypothetical protein